MNLANKITIARVCLIPVFGIFAWQFGAKVARGRPAEYLRVIAACVFILAAAMDGLDGFLARRFDQRSRLGAILDPVADEGLVMTATILCRWLAMPIEQFFVTTLATLFAVASGLGYIVDGSRQARSLRRSKIST